MGITQDCVKLKCDSQSAITWQRIKFFLEDQITLKQDIVESEIGWSLRRFGLKDIHTDDNVVDFLTKIVPAKKFKHCLNLINLVD
ncbi:hypothetical protein Prudu_001244 [Prunus dulcis]|uniref:Uncharacterized protein n=1 Tax=Prunus dulcis TaxID=3755 RepID=A0A4Y1QNB4_PRUDU|nr:hypothetical protein Prudu_001244 [Prunus dulcis]